MKFICKTKNFWNGRLWKPGDTAEVSQQDASASSVVAHFLKADEAAPPVALGNNDVAPTGDAVAPEPTEVDADGSNLRENLKTLCLRNGVVVHPRMSMKAMREALATRGITVN
jgi:hypothetical protein